MPKTKVKVKRYGTTNIKKFFKDVVEPTVLVVNRRVVRKLAQDSAQEIRTRIRRQLFDHEPLSPKYLKWKNRWGLDHRILIRSGKYVDNIRMVKVKFPRGEGYRVGVVEGERAFLLDSKGRIERQPGPLLTDLFTWLEYGTPTMPARPHFMPVYRDLVKSIPKIKKTIYFFFEKELKDELKRRRIK